MDHRQRLGRIFIALLLIFMGAVALIANLGILTLPLVLSGPNLIWMILFGLGGIAFMVLFFTDRANWWAIIPGLTLVALAILVGGLLPQALEQWAGAIFIGLLSLSFWGVFLSRRENWWAVIPAGVLLSVAALITAAVSGLQSELSVAILFFGMGLTFLILNWLPSPVQGSRWPLIPAAVLAILGLFFLIGAGQTINWLVGVILIIAGAWIFYRSFRG